MELPRATERARRVNDRSILISGAGISGAALAYWLERGGFAPTIVERAPSPRTGGYMLDFWGVGYEVADRMGLLPQLERDGYRIDEVRLVNERGRRITGVDAGLFRKATHDRYLSILRGDLANDVLDLVTGNVEVLFGDSIRSLTQDEKGVSVTFERAEARRFDLVVGADGLHSNVRRIAFGAGEAHERHLGYFAAAFTVDGYPHRDEHAYVSYSMPGRQIARYALRDGRSAFLLVFAADKVEPNERHEADGQRHALRRMFAGRGWECDEILTAMDRSDDLYFDAVAQMRMTSWSNGRVAVVGDAAYCPSLLAGQGSSFGIAGAYVLAQALIAADGDHTRAFAGYEHSFKPFIDGKQESAARYGSWFAPRTPLGVWLRNIITRLTHLPFVPALAFRSALADRIELPPDLTIAN